MRVKEGIIDCYVTCVYSAWCGLFSTHFKLLRFCGPTKGSQRDKGSKIIS